MRLYHNPKCSKSREAVKILESKDIQVEIVNYLSEGISISDLEILIKLDGIIRTNEREFTENPVDISDFKCQIITSNTPEITTTTSAYF